MFDPVKRFAVPGCLALVIAPCLQAEEGDENLAMGNPSMASVDPTKKESGRPMLSTWRA
jgi:hypothetical protein